MVKPAGMQKKPRVGYRFHPTEEELVAHFLKHKLKADDPSIHEDVAEIDVCKYEPWDLPAFSPIQSVDSEWFFFSRRDYKYSNSTRFNRKTPRGFWKPTCKDRKIKIRGTDRTIGTKKTLVFHDSGGVRTNWVIYEYHDATLPPDQRTYVLCRLVEKPQKITESQTYEIVYADREPSGHTISEDENPEEHCMDSMNQTSLKPHEFLNSMESDGHVNLEIQTPLNFETQTSHESDKFLDSTIQAPNELNKFSSSSTQTPHESDEFMNYLDLLIQTPHESVLIQTPHESDECMDSSIPTSPESDKLIQIQHESDKFVDSSIPTQHESDKVVDSSIPIPSGVYKFLDSMMETPPEPYIFLDSSMEALLKSYEFELNWLLQLPPTVYEHELLENDNI